MWLEISIVLVKNCLFLRTLVLQVWKVTRRPMTFSPYVLPIVLCPTTITLTSHEQFYQIQTKVTCTAREGTTFAPILLSLEAVHDIATVIQYHMFHFLFTSRAPNQQRVYILIQKLNQEPHWPI